MFKYYKNIIKKRGYGALFGMLLCVFLGLTVICFSLNGIISNGIISAGIGSTTGSNMFGINIFLGFLAQTNIGMIILGLFTVYTGLVFLPMNVVQGQNKEDYNVLVEENKIYISFKKYKFELDIDKIDPTNLMFHDKNGYFIGMTRAYQIYNGLRYFYPDLVSKKNINK